VKLPPVPVPFFLSIWLWTPKLYPRCVKIVPSLIFFVIFFFLTLPSVTLLHFDHSSQIGSVPPLHAFWVFSPLDKLLPAAFFFCGSFKLSPLFLSVFLVAGFDSWIFPFSAVSFDPLFVILLWKTSQVFPPPPVFWFSHFTTSLFFQTHFASFYFPCLHVPVPSRAPHSTLTPLGFFFSLSHTFFRPFGWFSFFSSADASGWSSPSPKMSFSAPPPLFHEFCFFFLLWPAPIMWDLQAPPPFLSLFFLFSLFLFVVA